MYGTDRSKGMLNYSQRSVKDPNLEDDALAEFIRSRTKDGFVTSAYWGANGEPRVIEPDDRSGQDPHRFQDEISRKLVRPAELTSIPRTIDHTLTGFHILKTDPNTERKDMPTMNDDQKNKLRSLQLSGADSKARGAPLAASAPGAPRFLYLDTTQQRMPGKFDDGVLKSLDELKKADDDIKQRIAELKRQPLTTESPEWRLTSEDYHDMDPIDKSSWRVMETDPDVPDERLEVYRSRYNNVHRNGPKRREHTFKTLAKGRNVDEAKLKETLGNSTRAVLPPGYQPWSAQEWMSTTHREHAKYDADLATSMNDRNSTHPLRNVNYQLTEQHEQSVLRREERLRTRTQGDWGTEYADHYQDRFDEAEVVKDHAGHSVFDIDHGTYTMYHPYHHPRDDTATGEDYTPAQVVPGQYMTMSAKPLHARNEIDSS